MPFRASHGEKVITLTAFLPFDIVYSGIVVVSVGVNVIKTEKTVITTIDAIVMQAMRMMKSLLLLS